MREEAVHTQQTSTQAQSLKMCRQEGSTNGTLISCYRVPNLAHLLREASWNNLTKLCVRVLHGLAIPLLRTNLGPTMGMCSTYKENLENLQE